jgi:cellulose synthase/poly-beta-1,6-N-acetylglucosamine synthase-like glycosyltransferase
MYSSRVLVGICAYNEENNIKYLLQNLVSEQDLPKNCRIIVVCSGCTDKTPQIVMEYKKKDARIEAIIERIRKGKANALNKIFVIAKKSADILVLVNADALPERGSITKLISKLEKGDVGATFARAVPFSGFQGLCYGIVRAIWRLNYIISLNKPKLSGELCAIRTSYLQKIPENVATDEPYLELTIRKQGYEIAYVPESIVYIRCPLNVVDLLKQRRRIWAGHMQLQRTASTKVPTSSFRTILKAISALRLTEVFYAVLGGFVEIVAYLQAKVTLSKGRVPYIWEPIRSTKTSI